jgi:RNA polymerase sigma-70 factor, ECF subfamily
MDDDIKLMLEFKGGSKEAFNRLVDKYSKPIINYIYRFTGSREDSEDLAQDVFMKIFNSAKNYEASAKFTTWLYRIASNISIDYIRKRKSKGPHDSLDEHKADETSGMQNQLADKNQKPADKLLEQKETGENIERALQTLPENQRAAIILKIYGEKSYAEIASILGTSPASVESLMWRARQGLKNKLNGLF